MVKSLVFLLYVNNMHVLLVYFIMWIYSHTSYCSGSKNGKIHLWTVQGKCPSDVPQSEVSQSDHKGLVSHVTCLEGHPAPITSLMINEEACLLASGCKAGSVRVWDLHVS